MYNYNTTPDGKIRFIAAVDTNFATLLSFSDRHHTNWKALRDMFRSSMR